ncbi:Z1 domain-containing protein [Providencia rettgeri]|uniref:Z1 domain-containing protein n=1 Tax=Providencia TaxID=586 RepID=UPI002050F51A|nr:MULTISPECIES: Z1 domain-containing protein [Providencia]MCX9124526.1 Z1 domain-containing protein [Providencia rettgeri]MCX9128114.1 Z1 domain-containing protein [Providencia rettgeri]UPQ39066.1 Z1 domain-containing protein [Providencia rettgeri]
MNLTQNELEKAVIAALIAAFNESDTFPSREEIKEKAEVLAPIMGYKGDLRNIIVAAEVTIPSRMSAGVSLVDIEAAHDEEWMLKREMSSVYADAYTGYLKSENWQPAVINTLMKNDCSKILGLLQDPTSNGTWNRRGLVIGHVQSGKTASYMGVIAKAADAGYKFIIVIAGIHNNLRKQTQERIDEGFIGRSSDPSKRANIGVGLNVGYPYPATLTNINDDFNENTASRMGWKLNDFSKPIILVIKKNVHTLDALHKWLKAMNAQGDGRISDVPMLMIDDEADNASINTNKDDVKPTRTNAAIRTILGLFTKSCYVGYTATPFANIFINPNDYDNEAREELFPKDFIYSLDAPTTYFGPDKVFIDDVSSNVILKCIDDCEKYLPFTHKNGSPVAELPPSLYRALDQFIVARAIRNLRGQQRKHCSMLINVSRFVSVQKEVKSFISLRIEKMRNAVKANYMMPEDISEKNNYMKDLKRSFYDEFSDGGFTWEEIKKELWNVFQHIRTYVINSKSDEKLDFGKYKKDDVGLSAIAIGGLSLSRGLTIEGLTISYMYRNTRMYDTLMQMGRWFGYRPGFEDICRVYLPQDSIDWYSHIAKASEELRQQIRCMRRADLSPKDFGLYVQSHQDSLLVTAANKMRNSEKLIINQNFTGKLIESTLLPLKSNINIENEKLIGEYWEDQFGGVIEKTEKGWFIPNISTEKIEEFLIRFKSHKDAAFQKSSAINYLQAIASKYPKGDVLLISKGTGDADNFRLGAQERTAKDATPEDWRLTGYRLASRGDEKLGLDDSQLKAAVELALEDDESRSKKPSDFHYRVIRNKPLLMLHVLEPTQNIEGLRVPAWGVSYPDGLYHTQIEVVANRIWIEKMYGALDDDLAVEEDYDDE